MSEKTIFEKICAHEIPANIAHEDDFCVAFFDIEPQAPTHLLIVPKQKIARISEAQPQHKELLGHLLLVAAQLARKYDSANKGFRLVVNNGPDGGESVPHLHVHFLSGRRLNWPPG